MIQPSDLFQFGIVQSDIYLVVVAMLGVLVLMKRIKKTLYLFGISDFVTAQRIKNKSNPKTFQGGFLKTSLTKNDKLALERAYLSKQKIQKSKNIRTYGVEYSSRADSIEHFKTLSKRGTIPLSHFKVSNGSSINNFDYSSSNNDFYNISTSSNSTDLYLESIFNKYNDRQKNSQPADFAGLPYGMFDSSKERSDYAKAIMMDWKKNKHMSTDEYKIRLNS